MMANRYIRAATSFIGIMVLYGIYSFVAVPFIEPAKTSNAGEGSTTAAFNRTIIVDDFRRRINDLFSEPSWQRNSAKMLRNEETALLFQEYEPADNGGIRIKPCTVVFLSNPFNQQQQNPVILQAPEGAVLKFDRPLNMNTASIGKPVSGRLIGDVQIHSSGNEKGLGKLEIKTSNVQINKEKLWTPNQVQFQYDGHHGSGKDLIINLAEQTLTPNKKKESKFAALASIELVELHKLYLRPTGNFLGHRKQSTTSNKKPPPAPVQVTCQGPCKLDFQNGLLQFDERVDVRQLHQDGNTDSLQCDRLLLSFRQGKADPDAKEKSIQMQRMIAVGTPVVLKAPSRYAFLTGNRLIYDWTTEKFKVESHQNSIFQYQKDDARHRFEATVFEYLPDNNQSIGRLTALGAGTYSANLEDGQQVTASWSNGLRLHPAETGHMLELIDQVDLSMPDTGNLQANRVRILLEDSPKLIREPNADKTLSLRPKRFVATGNVRFQSPKIHATCQRLQALFKHIAKIPKQIAAIESNHKNDGAIYLVSHENTIPTKLANRARFSSDKKGRNWARFSAATRNAQSSKQPKATQLEPIRVFGDAVYLSLVLANQELHEVEMISVKGNALLTGIESNPGSARPFQLEGDLFRVTNPNNGNALVHCEGRPSRIELDGSAIEGATIDLDQQKNEFWVDGAGKATFQLAKDFEGNLLTPPVDANVYWQQRMEFNGLDFTFVGQVEMRTPDIQMRSELLRGRLNRKIQFTNQQGKAQQTSIAMVTASRDVRAAYRTMNSEGLESTNFLYGPELTLDQNSGNIQMSGPGKIIVVKDGFQSRNSFGNEKAQQDSQVDRNRLTFLRTDFQNRMQGNFKKGFMEFEHDVQSIYGPIYKWNEEIPMDGPLGKDDVHLICDRLVLVEIPNNIGRRVADIRAKGRVVVTGQAFEAQGDQLSFDQKQQLMTLKGNGRKDAVVLTKDPENGRISTKTHGRELRFWPDRLEVQLSELKDLEFRTIGR